MAPPRADPGEGRTLAGRVLLLSLALLVVFWIAEALATLPVLLEIVHRVVSVAFVGSSAWVVVSAVVRNRRKLLWRVRRKLVASYVLLGVIPVALVFLFALAGGIVLYNNVAAYVFHEGVADLADQVDQAAVTAAAEVSRDPASVRGVLDRKIASFRTEHQGLSIALVPVAGGPAVSAGTWRYEPPPVSLPHWVLPNGFKGTLAMPAPGAGAGDVLLIRAVAATANGDAVIVADLPVDADVIEQVRQRTGARMLSVTVGDGPAGTTATPSVPPQSGGGQSLFKRTVVFMDVTVWTTGASRQAAITLDAPVGALYQRVAEVQSSGVSTSIGRNFITFLVVIGVFFLIVQGCALVFGVVLARSITHAVHELFVGTERVRQADFSHRIRIESRDQLGDLAESFNRMSAGMELFLQVQREKQRLDDELRIARDIQRSLLPSSVPAIDGLSLADLCEPAREVGGDYYDFFRLGPRQLGLLVADVSGKGTSAALYMAELKGLMLALSHIHRSPRQLLVEMNHLLADHLDNRSFITMTYAVIDLEAGTLTHARAGHTPLLIVSGGRSDVIVPSGMVLGLRLPGASERFADLLEEHTCALRTGDVVVLYTDGVTEATNSGGDLFGDEALARVVTAHCDLDAAGIRERVVRDVKAFVGDADPHDDMTMIVVKLTQNGLPHE
jgi:sigma-B regulation protein RsbU (phosphoserine phosphatase)